jgi:hypothetical protein
MFTETEISSRTYFALKLVSMPFRSLVAWAEITRNNNTRERKLPAS